MIGTIVTGFFVGLLARFFIPGKDAMGFIMTTVLGVLGAWLAGILGRALGWYLPGQPVSFLASIIGAVILLGIYNFTRRRHHQEVHT